MRMAKNSVHIQGSLEYEPANHVILTATFNIDDVRCLIHSWLQF